MIHNLKEISIIDYGIGNLYSICNSIKAVGMEPCIVSTPEEVGLAHHLILPGVGAFYAGVKVLKERGLDFAIKEYVKSGKHLLGVCLGMQLLMTQSDEFGPCNGLDLIPGKVKPLIIADGYDPKVYKIPHIGWNNIEFSFQKIAKMLNSRNGVEVYFLHSYYVCPDDENHIAATTTHGGLRFCAINHRDNVMGYQFHPEKSGKVGLKLLKSFCNIK